MSVTAFMIMYLTLGLAWAWHRTGVRPSVCEADMALPLLRVFRVIAWPVDALCDWASLGLSTGRDGCSGPDRELM